MTRPRAKDICATRVQLEHGQREVVTRQVRNNDIQNTGTSATQIEVTGTEGKVSMEERYVLKPVDVIVDPAGRSEKEYIVR